MHVNVRVEGSEHLGDGRNVYFSKHQSAWETLAFQTIFPPYAWVLKREALWIPVFGWGLAVLRPIAIRRGGGRKVVKQVVEAGVQRLNEGMGVLIFPEGTRVAVGETGRFGMGGLVLAVASGRPAVPIAHNAGILWPAKKLLVARPGTVTIRIGAPIDTKGMDEATLKPLLKTWIDENTRELEQLGLREQLAGPADQVICSETKNSVGS